MGVIAERGVPVLRRGKSAGESASEAAAAVERAAAAANEVKVYPGGAVFSTITAAIDSIGDASQQKPYSVMAGPGTFPERVTLKPYVYLEGAGAGQTVVQADAQGDQGTGTLTAASFSGVGGVRIESVGGTWGSFSVAFVANAVTSFWLKDCVVSVDDGGAEGINLRATQIDLRSPDTGSSLEMIACTVAATARSDQSVPIGINTWNRAAVTVQPGSKIVATGGLQSFGVSAGNAVDIDILYAYVQGGSYAIYMPGPGGSVTADHCQIDGPVSPGVHVIDKASGP